MKRKLFDKANFGNITKNGGKIVLNASKYDFEFEFQNLKFGEDGKKTFGDGVVIPVLKEEVYRTFAKGLIEPFIQEYNRARFKIKEITTNTTFANIRVVFRSLYAVQLIGAYEIADNGMKNRRTMLKVYKLNDWNEKKLFDKEPANFGGHIVASYEFEALPLSKGAWVYDDIIAINELQEIIEDCYFKRSSSYNSFLEELSKESDQPNQGPAKLGEANTSGNNGYNQHYKPKGVSAPDAANDVDDDFDLWD